MNYHNIYDAIIEKFRNTVPHGYYEVHHIIPRCLGGGNEKENLVNLPARYHFVAHLCLARIYSGKHDGKLTIAAFLMSKDNKHGSREYEWLRSEYSKVRSAAMMGNKNSLGFKVSDETRAKLSAMRLGVPRRPEVIAAMIGRPAWNKGKKMKPGHGDGARKEATGKKFTDEQRARCSAAQMGNTKGTGKAGKKYGKNKKERTPEHCQKLSLARSKDSLETKEKRRQSIIATMAKKKAIKLINETTQETHLMANYVYSTLSSPVTYVIYAPKIATQMENVAAQRITINGGANIANKLLYTPKGIATSVTDDELALLEKDSVFIQHKKNGFITVSKSKKDADIVARDMKEKDSSAPVTPEDYAGRDADGDAVPMGLNDKKKKPVGR